MALALASTIAVVSVAGCSNDRVVPAEDLASQIRSAAASTVAASSLRFTFNAAIDGQLQVHTEFAGKPAGNGSGRVVNGQRNIPFLAIDGRFFIGYADLPTGKKWVGVSEEELAAMGIDSTVGDQRDPQQALALLSSIKNPVAVIATEVLSDVETTRYRFSVDINELLAQPGGAFTKEGAERLRGLLGDTAGMDAWKGVDGKVHRIRYGVDLSKAPARPREFPVSGRLEYQYDFADFDAVDDAKAPAADQVLTLDEYKASPRVGPGDPLAPPEG